MKDFNIFKWQETDKCIHYHENPQVLRYSEFFNTDSGEKSFLLFALYQMNGVH